MDAPEILVVRLLRFTFEEYKDKKGRVYYREVKLREDCEFEEYLNLSDFTDSETPLFYRLDGVVSHSGDNTSRGHYVAAVREQNGRTFCRINDSTVSKSGGNLSVLERPLRGFDPYVLVYSKV